MAEMQTIPARHGVATFVPAGQTIKIVNTSGTQVIDTWAFALPKPEEKKDGAPDEKQEDEQQGKQEEKPDEKKSEQKTEEKAAPKATPKKKKDGDLPSQEDAEKATQNLLGKGEGEAKDGKDAKDAKDATPQKSTWSSYVPSLPSLRSSGAAKGAEAPKKGETEQQKNSRTWGSYFPSGKGFSSYIPSSASNTVSSFAKGQHEVDKNKTYVEQLQDFSKTPVGAAGLAALTGSGYGGSLYAGYSAYNSKNAPDAPPMEYMSMPHSRAGTLHMRPQVNDTLVSNLREPMLTLVEDTSPGIHDTLIAACDPYRYQGLGVKDWVKHGSCAENLVLALKELNERAGLKGAKGVGADVTINAVPAPLNLFMNIPWDDSGDLAFKAPKGKEGDFVRLKAERDMVVVMSACPQDVLEINNKKPTDAHFVVESEGENTNEAVKRSQPPAKKRPAPRKLNSSRAPSTAGTEGGGGGGGDAKGGAAAAAAAAKKPAAAAAPAKKAAAPPPKKAEGDAAATPAPAKKPAAKPAAAKPAAQPKKEAAAAKDEANGGEAATAPAEKKKPKKLAARPKAAAASKSSRIKGSR
ncbi:hypothetical protein B0A55_08325 [Friedmanniomyces simplex]|uniref:DUF1989 domain-containing protein n=1 Tax=Friedmanniomyces simplex TaxID=329884 RepID=A0A4U0X573_9PEZI|nr:hypothetical protein B0A55_08325 [Friedmanniomyces simplex]